MANRWRPGSVVVGAAVLVAATIPISIHAEGGATLPAAQTMFYNGRYAEAAAATADLCTPVVTALRACELRSSAFLFQLRRAVGEAPDKEKAFKQCESCGAIFATFVADTRQAQVVARTY